MRASIGVGASARRVRVRVQGWLCASSPESNSPTSRPTLAELLHARSSARAAASIVARKAAFAEAGVEVRRRPYSSKVVFATTVVAASASQRLKAAAARRQMRPARLRPATPSRLSACGRSTALSMGDAAITERKCSGQNATVPEPWRRRRSRLLTTSGGQ